MTSAPASGAVTTATARQPFVTGYDAFNATPSERPDVDDAEPGPDVDFPLRGAESAAEVAPTPVLDVPDVPVLFGTVAWTRPPPPRSTSPLGHEVDAVSVVPTAGAFGVLSAGALTIVLPAIVPAAPVFPAGPLAPGAPTGPATPLGPAAPAAPGGPWGPTRPCNP